MAALTKDRNTPFRARTAISVAVKAAAKIYAGAMVALDATGHAAPASAAPGLVALGRAEVRADNSAGADGAIQALVRREVFRWDNSAGDGAVAATDVLKTCYIADDQTVTIDPAGSSPAGTVLGVDSEGVWVEPPALPAARVLRASKTHDFGAINARSSEDAEIEVPGAAVGDLVAIALPAAIADGITFSARVSEAGKVKLRASNFTAAAVDPDEADFAVAVIKP